jgi:hypothetical protein
VLALQSTGINGTEFNTPEPYRFTSNRDVTLSQEILNAPMAEIEAIVEQTV